ncbi:SsrA-binding protein SmpB [bacterium]|jgi:SsrA-binding protein|nr:SsrA-binding protein SmpB [bacterium]MBT3903866.1 SsrA-binding protein SmpB [bacterium]MBT5346205.1 SsrA-binding protein SmpB [bacterium]MBT6131001.1 SsrA-binding protein SmpB [bacterium]MBT6529149.1 SsrA-binding protein SmpB [bacterium]
MKIIAKNKKAFFDYQILETIEAGLVLTGDEVKSLRSGNVSMSGAFAHEREGELFMVNVIIVPYQFAYDKTNDSGDRRRKLLLSRKQINQLTMAVARRGITIVPLKMYFNKKSLVKVEIGLCKARKKHDKRQLLKDRDIDRETKRDLKNVTRD